MSHPLFCICEECSDRTSREHADADARCGRDWLDGGCTCAPCRNRRVKVRAQIADVGKAFDRVTEAENNHARVRRFLDAFDAEKGTE